MRNLSDAQLILVVVPLTLFAGYWLADAARSKTTRRLPRWAWVALCAITIPGGALAYVLFGRERSGAA